jgi:hypothetical protein
MADGIPPKNRQWIVLPVTIGLVLAFGLVIFFALIQKWQFPNYPDETAVGMNKQDILSEFGKPGIITIHGVLRPVVFRFDETRKLIMVVKSRQALSEKASTIPMDFAAYSEATAADQRSMLYDLVRQSENGELPDELKTADDVQRTFPDVMIREYWRYEPTLMSTGAILCFDDETGVCDEVIEDFGF